MTTASFHFCGKIPVYQTALKIAVRRQKRGAEGEYRIGNAVEPGALRGLRLYLSRMSGE